MSNVDMTPRPPNRRALLWVRRGRTLIAHRDGASIVVQPSGRIIRRKAQR